VKFDTEYFTKICRETPDFVTIGEKYKVLHMKTQEYLFFGQQ